MNILSQLRRRFTAALSGLAADPAALVELVTTSADPKFGDYQANFAMPLGKQLGRPPRAVAEEVVGRLDVADICEPPEIAGPGFINLRLKGEWLAAQLRAAGQDERLGIAPVEHPRTYVIDYSAPNVAKPMHVGHIRSTVIGAALDRTLRFLGHRVISDNHIGDWGTQFGMIIYGYKHFLDAAGYAVNPVAELSRLYRLVNRLVDYHESKGTLPELREKAIRQAALVEQQKATKNESGNKAEKDIAKALRRGETQLEELQKELAELERKLAGVEQDPQLAAQARLHPDIGRLVLLETAKLHAGDEENLRLWREFLPPCLADIDRIYRRLGVRFDRTLGESFYHDALGLVVDNLLARGIARESEGAICVFLAGQQTPLIVRKQDGAYLYATTDLATIQYRVREWSPDAILYVVDHRQGLHFEQLFATARLWGYDKLELKHVSFGTVLGEDRRPYRTRSGDTVGLEGLLDEAVERALAVVAENERAKPAHQLPEAEQHKVAEAVGIGAIKYADLSQNRTSDYVFSYDKMLAMNGNTATYMQYAHARVRSIFARGEVDAATLRASQPEILLADAAERALALAILRFAETLEQVVVDYRPNLLTDYLFDLANRYSTFFEHCPVLKAETDALRASRLMLCDLTARTLRQGLWLLGIEVVEKM